MLSLGWIAGHSAVLHACTLEDESFVGMGATVLDGAVVEKGAMVAAGSLVTQKTRIPSGQVSPLLTFPARFQMYTKYLI
jgi:carbonic anhydrase/acetyltransferase-like protein (isoleucine patch superfamily)